jgi:hypothetical protein
MKIATAQATGTVTGTKVVLPEMEEKVLVSTAAIAMVTPPSGKLCETI